MITNERQYRITRRALAGLREDLGKCDLADMAIRIGSRALAEAELSGVKSQIESTLAELREYEALRAGTVSLARDPGLAELPHTLIRARIARGLTQRQLGELVGLKEQQIQRYETQEYQSASLRRLREVADALGLGAMETPAPATPTGMVGDGKPLDRERYRLGPGAHGSPDVPKKALSRAATKSLRRRRKEP